MIRRDLRIIAVALCLVGGLYSHATPAHPASESKQPVTDSKAIEGLWSGAWGGGGRNGVVFHPVLTELLIEGDHVELHGFRNVDRLTGTVRFDARAKQLQITPKADDAGQPAPKTINYTYEIKGDELTLIDSDEFPISLTRIRVARDPLGNAQVEFVAASGINDAGDLLVTAYAALRAGQTGTTYHRPENRSLKTKQATVHLVQESGSKKITVDEARGLIRESTPVVIAYRDDNRRRSHQFHKLWKETGSPMPDSEAVWRTFSRILRPGTLVFVLSARENVPQP